MSVGPVCGQNAIVPDASGSSFENPSRQYLLGDWGEPTSSDTDADEKMRCREVRRTLVKIVRGVAVVMAGRVP